MAAKKENGIIRIKNKELSKGKPLVCVPIMGSSAMEICDEVKRVNQMEIDMVEWRVDFFEKLDDLEAVRAVLNELQQICKYTIVLVTYRSKEQGGVGTLKPDALEKLLLFMARTHCPDLMDVEYFSHENPEKLIADIRKTGVFVVASHHDFNETPNKDVLLMLLHKMKEDADIVKIAVMPNDEMDVLELLESTVIFKVENPNTPIITMSMGKLGAISRICGEIFGSCVTFGTIKDASAPGQLPIKELHQLMDLLHEYGVE